MCSASMEIPRTLSLTRALGSTGRCGGCSARLWGFFESLVWFSPPEQRPDGVGKPGSGVLPTLCGFPLPVLHICHGSSNALVSSATGMSPFLVMCSFPPPLFTSQDGGSVSAGPSPPQARSLAGGPGCLVQNVRSEPMSG